MRARPRLRVIGGLVAGAILPSCGVAGEGASPPPSIVTATPSDERKPVCDGNFPFEPTYLPDGFSRNRFPGPADGGRAPDRLGQVIVHYRDDSRAIEIRRPGTVFVELAQADNAPTISVLGADTSGFGPIEPYGREFIVQFTYPADASSQNDCALYSLNEYGIPLDELTRVAEGLRGS
jgi:hypothetical protein